MKTTNNWVTTATQYKPVLRHQFPTLFSESWLDGIDSLCSKAFEVPNVHYPYNIVTVTDKEGKATGTRVEIALAGVGKDNIEVRIVDRTLRINVKSEDVDDDVVYERRGISKRKASYSFALNANVDESKITSSYKDGLLVVEVPTVQPKTQTIEVKVD